MLRHTAPTAPGLQCISAKLTKNCCLISRIVSATIANPARKPTHHPPHIKVTARWAPRGWFRPPSPLPYGAMADPISPPRTFSMRRLVPLGLLAAVWAAFMLAGGYRYLSLPALAENREWLCGLVQSWGVAAAIVYIAVYATLVALSVPGGAVLTIAGGFFFGTGLGALCAVIGATLGATAVFLVARAGLGGFARRAGPLVGRLEAGFRADAFNYLLVLRLVPLFPFWLVNLVPALVGVGLPRHVLATDLGLIP